MVRQTVQHGDTVDMQSRKHLKVHPIEWYRPARSASASPLRHNHSTHGTLLVCRAVHPMLADSFRHQALQHYPLGMRLCNTAGAAMLQFPRHKRERLANNEEHGP